MKKAFALAGLLVLAACAKKEEAAPAETMPAETPAAVDTTAAAPADSAAAAPQAQ